MKKIPELSPEERDLRQPMATALALDFLKSQMDTVETRIKSRIASLADAPIEAATPNLKATEAELMQDYQQEKNVIQSLTRECVAQECDERPFPHLFRQRLEEAQQRVTDLERLETTGEAFRLKRRQARIEKEILAELLGKWLIWLKENGLGNTTCEYKYDK